MTKDEKREYDREWYRSLSPERKHELIQRNAAKKREYRKDPKFREKENARTRALHDNDEYRALRRARYAAKHANDPMTPHRAAMIAAMKKACDVPWEERKAKAAEKKAHKQARKDMKL
jgi:hypothetical protein